MGIGTAEILLTICYKLPRWLTSIFLAGMLGACAGSTSTDTGISLFDGSSLSGWEPSGAAEWSVADGVIVGQGAGDGFIATTETYGDFHLRLEFWVDASTNSGVFLRCQDRDRIHPESCFELNIWDEHPKQEARTGAIVFRVMPPRAHVETVGKWNTYEVTAKGALLEVKVNGVTTALLEDADPTPGFIALQHWQEGVVKFRNIELRPI